MISTQAARLALVLGLCALALGGGTARAFADGVTSGADVMLAQSLGDRDLTVVLRRVTTVPGPLHVDVITHAGTAPGLLALAVTPTGVTSGTSALPAAGATTARSTVDLGAAPGTYSAVVDVDRAGPWELALDDGQRVARIPFVVHPQVTTPPERAVYGGFVATGFLLAASVVVATRARRAKWVLVPAVGVVMSLTVAVTSGLLSAYLPSPPQPGVQFDATVDNVTDPYARSKPIADYSRPPVMIDVRGAPVAGQATDLDLTVTDGATGAAVDDLLVHDGALIHLLVISPTGRLRHAHPIRTGSGTYQLRLVLPEPGHYAVSAEVARRGGGVQHVRVPSGLDIAPTGTIATPPAEPIVLSGGSTTGATTVDGTSVSVAVTAPVAGRPTTITARVGDTPDLQPWLGMAGHLIVAGPLSPGDTDVGTAVQRSPVWAHAHSMGAATGAVGLPPVNGDSTPDESVAAYGPDVPFLYSFSAPGRYRLWIQVERRYTVLTAPVVVDVAAPSQEGQR